MSVAARLAGFAAVLVLIFGATLAIGSVSNVKPDRAQPASARKPDGKLRLVADTTIYPLGQTKAYTFRIVDRRGATVRDFDVEHTKRLHLIAVRRDLTGYQHLHPVQQADGSWSVPLRFGAPGVYRVYADFRAHGGEKTTLATDVFVPGDFQPRPIPVPATEVHVDGYDVALNGDPRAGAEGDLEFTVSRNGQPVSVQPYLGADGHLVALREGDLAFLHVHPNEDDSSIGFEATFPTTGSYRLFLQFKVGGEVQTVAFTEEVQ
jgi:hypothetical protein